jgi:hypothetical protein
MKPKQEGSVKIRLSSTAIAGAILLPFAGSDEPKLG